MKTYLFTLLFLTFIIAGCSNSNQDNKEQIISEKPATEVVEVIDVIELLANPKEYDGKLIAVAGTVTHVCQHSGKRLHLMGSDEKTNVRLEAGEIGQFDRELEGSDIIAKGVFHREVVDEEYLAKWSETMKKEGKGDHESHEDQEEDTEKMQRYRKMMGETEKGYLENYWVEGISFETTSH